MHRNKMMAFAALLAVTSASAAPLSINLTLMDGENPFFYHNPLKLPNGQSMTVSDVRLYISNVALVKADGSEVPVKGLSLGKLKMGTPPQNIEIFKGNAPLGEYKGIRFDVGLPRDVNHREATTAKAPLSIEDGMYWAWNSGYIFLSVHGKTSAAGGEKDVALHVGGDNHRLTVNLADLQKPGTEIKVSAQGASVPVTLNLAALLSKGVAAEAWDLSQARYQQVHFGPVADQLAANAQTAFGIAK